jgi:hypothetical protein
LNESDRGDNGMELAIEAGVQPVTVMWLLTLSAWGGGPPNKSKTLNRPG